MDCEVEPEASMSRLRSPSPRLQRLSPRGCLALLALRCGVTEMLFRYVAPRDHVHVTLVNPHKTRRVASEAGALRDEGAVEDFGAPGGHSIPVGVITQMDVKQILDLYPSLEPGSVGARTIV